MLKAFVIERPEGSFLVPDQRLGSYVLGVIKTSNQRKCFTVNQEEGPKAQRREPEATGAGPWDPPLGGLIRPSPPLPKPWRALQGAQKTPGPAAGMRLSVYHYILTQKGA